MFVDFCDGPSLLDPISGERIKTQLFVGALGASSYTFAIATCRISPVRTHPISSVEDHLIS